MRAGAAIGVLLVCALPLWWRLGARDLGSDEAIYAFAVDSIVASGDWATPRALYPGHPPFLEKPPLMFWLTALPLRAGWLPADELGHRAVAVLLSCAVFLYVFATGSRIGGTLAGAAAALFLFAQKDLVLEHGLRELQMEPPLVLAYAAGVHHFLAWTEAAGPRARAAHLAAVGLAFCLGFLTKFAAAIFLPAILAAGLLAAPTWRQRLWRDRTTALVVLAGVVIVVSPWFAIQHVAHGAGFWDVIVGQHVVQRFTSFLDPSHVEPAGFYLDWLADSMLRSGVWLFAGLGAVLMAVRFRSARWAPAILLAAWLLLPLAALSALTSKLEHYFLPFLAPCALAGGLAAAWLAGDPGAADVALPARLRAIFARRVGAAPRLALALLGLVSLAAAAATAARGGLELEVGGRVLAHNHSLGRPLGAGLALLATACAPRTRWLVLGLLLVPVWGGYGSTWEALGERRQPLGVLRTCLSQRAGDASLASSLPIESWLPRDTPRTHAVGYYGVAGRDGGSAPLRVPAWMLERGHRERAPGALFLRVPGAWVRAEGRDQIAVLALPPGWSGCAARLESAGAVRLD